ncbi:FadR family transcriptional regulator [Echinicola sp. CAU 1574]|uniref:FadR family transcriptional regulator n=1 Tax=Echinicola arenosa TaxID=2774144 RepID=A0ABR9APZ3_9BACT|nr:FadR/GntR family transcriptional regulator [Echinicola arenosa]MBD8490858.1 FadR family transcriptional regulator [Echinicola arenosa]
MTFQQIGQAKSLSQRVEEELTRAIREGEYRPGQKIPTEHKLGEIFQVSRTAIREAIKTLSAKGIVEVRKGSGAYVSEISVQNASNMLNMFFELSSDTDLMLQTIEARRVLEPRIAAEAAIKRNKEDLLLLEQNMIKMRDCPLEDKKVEADLDNDFHRILLSITDNKVLELLLGPLFSLMPKYKMNVFAKPASGNLEAEKAIMLKHHQHILDAVSRQDPAGAHEAMEKHLHETRKNFLHFTRSVDRA